MKKDIKTKHKPILVELTEEGDTFEFFSGYVDKQGVQNSCTCSFIRIADKFFDDKETGKANVRKINYCEPCLTKARIMRVEPQFFDCYIPYGTLVVYHEHDLL